jgi:hypothetical protein
MFKTTLRTLIFIFVETITIASYKRCEEGVSVS